MATCETHSALANRPSAAAPAAPTVSPPITATPPPPRAIDPATGWTISPIVGAALCIKPRGLLTARQAAKVAALKSVSSDFVAMPALAMQFRGVLRSRDVKRLNKWLDDAHRSGIYAMQHFAHTLRHDIHAVRNAVAEPWSNGQTEGQINRLKTLTAAIARRRSKRETTASTNDADLGFRRARKVRQTPSLPTGTET